MSSPTLWYLNRSTGLVLVAMLTLSASLGVLALRSRAGRRLPAFVPQSVHRNVSLLAVALLGVHVGSAVTDEYVDIRWWQAVVPFGSAYQPLWVAVGALATDLLVAIVLTSVVRQRLPHRLWRRVHLLAYAAWALGIVHGLGIGTDRHEPYARWIYVASVGVFLAACVVRLLPHRATREFVGTGSSR